MKWLSLDESFSVCSCLLTVACNSEMQRFLFFVGYLVCGGISGLGYKFNCAARVWFGQTISGTGRDLALV